MRKMFVLLIINNLSLRSIISKTYMKMINRFLLCLIAFGVINIGHSQNNNNLSVSQITGAPNYLNVITTAVPFLTIAPDARAGGMGDAGVATSADANSIHWNPAKLAFADKEMGVGISYTPWLRALVPDINLAYLSFYKKFNDQQALAVSLLYFSLGNINFTGNTGEDLGSFNPNEFSIDLAYSRKLSDDFSAGVALRYIYSNLTGNFSVSGAQTHPGTAAAADLSAYYHHEVDWGGKGSIFTAGVDISNIGSKMSYTNTGYSDFIPTQIKIGPALKMKLDEYNTLCITVDFNKLLVPTPPIYLTDSNGAPVINSVTNTQELKAGHNPNVSVPQGMIQSFYDAPGGFSEQMKEWDIASGIEYWYDKQFALRAGYFYEPVSKGGRQFFTVGAGLKYSVFGLDFAYLIPTAQRNPLENTLRFTLLFDFDTAKNKDSKDTPTTQ